jgi:hypothetical protein
MDLKIKMEKEYFTLLKLAEDAQEELQESPKSKMDDYFLRQREKAIKMSRERFKELIDPKYVSGAERVKYHNYQKYETTEELHQIMAKDEVDRLRETNQLKKGYLLKTKGTSADMFYEEELELEVGELKLNFTITYEVLIYEDGDEDDCRDENGESYYQISGVSDVKVIDIQ